MIWDGSWYVKIIKKKTLSIIALLENNICEKKKNIYIYIIKIASV